MSFGIGIFLQLLSLHTLRAQGIIYKVAGDSIVSAVEEVNDDEVMTMGNAELNAERAWVRNGNL